MRAPAPRIASVPLTIAERIVWLMNVAVRTNLKVTRAKYHRCVYDVKRHTKEELVATHEKETNVLFQLARLVISLQAIRTGVPKQGLGIPFTLLATKKAWVVKI